jgi:hypothetical protein
MLRNQREGVFLGGLPQLLVPAGEVELLAGCEGQGAGEVDGIVGAERMGAGALGRSRQKRVGDGMAEDPTPDFLEILEGEVELGRGKAPAFAHPSQGRGGLDMSDGGGADPICLGVGAPRLLGSGLVDQELDQCAGIEVEAQRRPSETYSDALLPGPRSLAGLDGR